MRSAASSRAIESRASDTPGEIAPPNTTMPFGAPRDGSHGGNRSSSGRISALPSGDKPAIARRTRLVTTSQLANRVNRVSKRGRPSTPIEMKRLEGAAKKPRILERMKNIEQVPGATLPLRSRLPPCGVARLGVVVRRIKPRQLYAIFHLAEHPALVQLMLGALMRHELQQVLRDDDDAVIIGNDDIAGKDRTAAASDRLLPADESQA